MPELVRLEFDPSSTAHPGVAVIRLDRPPVNAINSAMHAPLLAAARAAAADPAIRAVVIYGGERAFAAGADIKEMAARSSAEMAGYGRDLTDAIDAIARLPKPVIAAVTGYALGGGCELALAADFRILADDALIGLPEITLGVIPGAGGTQRLARIVGATRAKELVFSGRAVRGDEAVQLGIASRAVPKDDVLGAAMDWAGQLAAGATAAIAAAKYAIDGGLEVDLASGLRLESQLFAGLFTTDDQRIGMTSFVENGPGKASFTGR